MHAVSRRDSAVHFKNMRSPRGTSSIVHHHVHHHVHRDIVHHHGRASIPTMLPAAPTMVSRGTQTDACRIAPIAPDSRRQWVNNQLRKTLPAMQLACSMIIFIASRVNFGFGFKVPWLPFVGVGAP